MAEEQPVEQRASSSAPRSGAPTCSARSSSSSSFRSGAMTRGRSSRRSCGIGRAARARFTWPWERRRGAASGADVLYVHGWSDYFFNPELARFWTDAGARFFALDLRKYGRSLRPGQTPGYITNLADYDADIEAALAAMGHGAMDPIGASARPLILLGHSTGGLTLSLWAARNPGRAAALVLEQSVAGVPAEPHRARGAAAGDRVRGAREPDGAAAERRPRLLHAIDREGAGRRVGVLARVASRSGLHDASGLAHGHPRRARDGGRSASTSARPCSRSCRRDPR